MMKTVQGVEEIRHKGNMAIAGIARLRIKF